MYLEAPFPHLFLLVAGALILHITLCTMVETAMRTLTLAEITRFNTYHSHTAARLDYFHKRRMLPVITITLWRYCGLVIGLHYLLPILAKLDTHHLWGFVALIVLLLILFGHVLAESIGKRFREPIAFLCVHPLAIATTLLTPLTALFSAVSRLVDPGNTIDPQLISTDIKHLAQRASAENVLSSQQAHLIARSVELSGITASDIMVKKGEIKVISDTATLTEALLFAHLHHHTRFPLVHDNDTDQIVGYVNFKDIVGALRINPADPSLTGIKRPIESVPSIMPLPELLQVLTRGYQHIVIVTDHTQTTLGMVTLEDLMETLIGSLEDEYDKPPVFIIQLAEKRFCAGGGTSFAELRTKIEPHFPDWDLTIHDWISGLAKGTITDQFSTTYQGCTFTVRKTARGKVFDVIVEKVQPAPELPS